MAADNAHSQLQRDALKTVIDNFKMSSTTPLGAAQALAALPASTLATIIEDGLEFSGLGTYGGARALGQALAATLAVTQLTAAQVALLKTALGTGTLAALQTANKTATTGPLILTRLLTPALIQAGVGTPAQIAVWCATMEATFLATTAANFGS